MAWLAEREAGLMARRSINEILDKSPDKPPAVTQVKWEYLYMMAALHEARAVLRILEHYSPTADELLKKWDTHD